MDGSISELKDLFTKVSAKAKTIPALIQETNQILAGIDSEIPVWLEANPLEVGDYEEDERQDGSIRRWRKATLLGFCEMKNRWELAIRDVEFEIDKDDWGNEREFVTQPSQLTALADANAMLKTRAVYLLSDLEQLLRTEAESFLHAIEGAEELARGKNGGSLPKGHGHLQANAPDHEGTANAK